PAKPNSDQLAMPESKAAFAVVPLAMPMLIGPGGISTVIIYSSQASNWQGLVSVLTAGFFITLICYFSLKAAAKVSRLLGDTGMKITNRVMGLLLAAIAVEIIVSGLKALFPILAR
ncbi:MAG: MarC family protein, partial [Alysiella sp.]|uniref:MarC family protein n=1 Tax=Alysiella sp. TaxID=1872483 RepID=UPI0026DD21C7